MLISIEGCKDKQMEKEIMKAAHFYGSILFSNQMIKYIVIDIVFKTSIKDQGTCCVIDVNKNYKAREFEIELKRHRSLRSTLKTLAHEMVHVKQYAKGELNRDVNTWFGTYINTKDTPYHMLPWEAEAWMLDEGLYRMYRSANAKETHP